MKNRMRRLMICLTGSLVFSLSAGMAATAEEDMTEETTEEITTEEITEVSSEEETEGETEDVLEGVDGNKQFAIHISDLTQDEDWNTLAMVSDDKVETGVNIRDEANEEGAVMACIYRGGAVEVLDRGETWTKIRSGIVVGYIRSEYLVYGVEIKDMVDRYSIDGVKANWDDVHVFAQPDANAEIIHVANDGEVFPLEEDQGHWLTVRLDGKLFADEVSEDGEVQKAEDRLAYVSIEDVTKVVLVDAAVPLEEYFGEAVYEEEGEAEEYADDSSYTPDTPSSGGSSYTYTPAPSTGSGSTGNNNNTGNGSASTTTPSTEAPYDNNDDYEEDNGDDIYNDDGSGEEYEDGDDVEEVDDAEEYTDNAAAGYYEDGTYSEYTEDNAEEYPKTLSADYAETDTEDYSADNTENDTQDYSYDGAGDLDLLAAIIYCEAGNQSYDGMVAVGAVVMNRVYSSSFPNTISEVIYQSGQFTPASSGALSSALANGVPSACYDAAAAAMNGEDPSGGALYFNAGSGSGTQIGAHQFF